MKTALIITSISPPNHVLRACAEGCQQHGIDFIVIGDRKSPQDFHLDGCDFWSIERQMESRFTMARLLPEGHYSRKNLGYLIAMERGAEVIIETDDDNLPLHGFWEDRYRTRDARRVAEHGWVNPCRYFTDEDIWPRGFPLDQVKNPVAPEIPSAPSLAPIQQGLTDGNPDVDAIYRLTKSLPITFRQDLPLALGSGCKAPFNSQNTTWFSETFPLLYLPSTCSFRMTDIWRSFVAQRICWANGWDILFHSSTMLQERNPHNLMTDFKDEILGYMNNADICNTLDSLDIKSGIEHIPHALIKCYETFISSGFIHNTEINLLESWLLALDQNEKL